MRKLLLACALSILASAPVLAQEGDGRKIIENAVKAQGGEKSLERYKAFFGKAKGKIFIMGEEIDVALKIWCQMPDKVKSVVNLNIGGTDMEIISAFVGNKGWKDFGGQLSELEQNEIDDARESLHVETLSCLYGILADKGLTFTSLGESKVGDRAVVGVKVAKKDYPDVKLYFDKENLLILKSESRGRDPISNEEVTEVKLFSDFKEVAPGLKSAQKMVITQDGQRHMELTMLEETFVDRHDDRIFARPGGLVPR